MPVSVRLLTSYMVDIKASYQIRKVSFFSGKKTQKQTFYHLDEMHGSFFKFSSSTDSKARCWAGSTLAHVVLFWGISSRNMSSVLT